MPGVLISVTTVRTTADLGIAHAYAERLPIGKSERAGGEHQRENVKTVRYNLGKRLRNSFA